MDLPNSVHPIIAQIVHVIPFVDAFHIVQKQLVVVLLLMHSDAIVKHVLQ